MTPKQQRQFNIMRTALIKISREYQPTSRLRRNSEKQYGLDFEEAIEMAYENIQNDAAIAVKGVKAL